MQLPVPPAGSLTRRAGPRLRVGKVPPVDTSTLKITDSDWRLVDGVVKNLERFPPDTIQGSLLKKENFSGVFSTWDLLTVCKSGVYIPDNVMYRCARHMIAEHTVGTVFIVDPAIISHLIDLRTLRVNRDNVATYKRDVDKNLRPRWIDRLVQGYTVALGINFPKGKHWIGLFLNLAPPAILSNSKAVLYARIQDSMHTHFQT